MTGLKAARNVAIRIQKVGPVENHGVKMVHRWRHNGGTAKQRWIATVVDAL